MIIAYIGGQEAASVLLEWGRLLFLKGGENEISN